MLTLLSPNFTLEEVTRDDLAIASLAWGFALGFGWLTSWTATKQTYKIWKRYGTRSIHNTYIWLIWLEILVCLIFGIICWLYLKAIIPPSFVFYMSILTCWALQVQFLLQIIVNRCAILMPDRTVVWRLKFWIAALITAVNISVYLIWVPARLQISDEYIWINHWWDRTEKVIYLLIDGALNGYFIIIVKRNLISNGLLKYKRLTNFNIFIICFSLGMDVLIISTMSLKNSFVYMQFHPLAYMVKLKIEMSMADLIAKVARKKEHLPTFHTAPAEAPRRAPNHSFLSSFRRSGYSIQPLPPVRKAVSFKQHSLTTSEALMSSASFGGGTRRNSSEKSRTLDETGSGWDLSNRDLYMLQEVVIETDVEDVSGTDGSGQENFIPNRLVDDPRSRREAPIGEIWDGSAVNSTTVNIN